MAAAQLCGSMVAPRRNFAPFHGIRLSPSTFRVSPLGVAELERCFNILHLLPRKLPVSLCIKGNSVQIPGFEGDNAVQYMEDQINEPMKPNFSVDPNNEMAGIDDVVPPKRSAKLHDFCLGIPFGGFLFSMGLLGFLFSRSPISLTFGVAPGLATVLLSILSLKIWRSGKSNIPFILGQAAVAAVLAWKYSEAYNLTKKILPWGFYAFVSAAMLCFYSYVVLAGGNPPPKKLDAVPPS